MLLARHSPIYHQHLLLLSLLLLLLGWPIGCLILPKAVISSRMGTGSGLRKFKASLGTLVGGIKKDVFSFLE